MPLSPAEFARLIGPCWSTETSSLYSPANPASGQCSVTALVAQDHLGGAIARTRVGDAWHFYNLVDGERFDFTASQFDVAIAYEDGPAGREDALGDTKPGQYEALADAFRKIRQPPGLPSPPA